MEELTDKKYKCYNCKHRTEAFKVGKLTHYHCMSPTYKKQHNEGIDISPWETLRVFSDTCDEHELRLMPIGMFKGDKMVDVPASYLLWLRDQPECTPEIKNYIDNNRENLKMQIKPNGVKGWYKI
jgi:uncharacterized protein (DUF3820 family)